MLLLAELETPAGRLAAFSAHTSGEPCHTRAVAALVRGKAGPLPAVVMGDFNADDTSSAMRVLTHEAGWVDTFRHANPTAPGFTEGQDVDARRPTAGRRIDYVLLVPGARMSGRVLASRVVLDEPRGRGRVRWPSDHHGVLTDIALDRGAGSPLGGGRATRDLGHSRGAGAHRRPGSATAPPC